MKTLDIVSLKFIGDFILSKEHCTVSELLTELQSFVNAQIDKDAVLLDLLPILPNKASFKKALKNIYDIEIEISTDVIFDKKYDHIIERKNKLLEELEKIEAQERRKDNNYIESDFDHNRPLNKKIRDSIIETGRYMGNTLLLGLYVHDDRKIILYPSAVQECMDDPNVLKELLLSVLSHELFHAYQANRTKTMVKSWHKVVNKCDILVESLARYNEYLFLNEYVSLLRREGSPFEYELRKRINDILNLAYYNDILLCPYSGLHGLIHSTKEYKMFDKINHYQSKYIDRLITGDSNTSNNEIIYSYYAAK